MSGLKHGQASWFPGGGPFVLVGSEEQVTEATYRLHRIGYDYPAGDLQGGIAEWRTAGQPINTVSLVKPQDLYAQMQNGSASILVDVRLPKEWMGLRIVKRLLNMPIDFLEQDAVKLNPEKPVMTICNSAYLSSMGASVLLKSGFKDVRNLERGNEAWIDAGLQQLNGIV